MPALNRRTIRPVLQQKLAAIRQKIKRAQAAARQKVKRIRRAQRISNSEFRACLKNHDGMLVIRPEFLRILLLKHFAG